MRPFMMPLTTRSEESSHEISLSESLNIINEDILIGNGGVS